MTFQVFSIAFSSFAFGFSLCALLDHIIEKK